MVPQGWSECSATGQERPQDHQETQWTKGNTWSIQLVYGEMEDKNATTLSIDEGHLK